VKRSPLFCHHKGIFYTKKRSIGDKEIERVAVASHP